MATFRCFLDGKEIEVETIGGYEHTEELIRSVVEKPTRFSLIKAMADSPWFYLSNASKLLEQPSDESLAAKLGAGPGRERGDCLRLGSAIHHLILGSPEKVVIYDSAARDAYAPEPVANPGARAVRQGRAWRAFEEEHTALGHTILNEKEMLECRAMAAMMLRSEAACELLFAGAILEERIDWTWCGVPISSRPDSRVPGVRVVDLKSCADSRPSAFGPLIYKNHYHTQLQCYRLASGSVDGTEPADAVIVAIDRKRPPRIYTIPAEGLELGEKNLRAWFEDLATCVQALHFPFNEKHVAHPPPWLLEDGFNGPNEGDFDDE